MSRQHFVCAVSLLLAAVGRADTVPQFTLTQIGNLPGGTKSWAWDVTPDGDVVGDASTIGHTTPHAFYWDALTTTLTDLGTLTGIAGDESRAYGVSFDQYTAGNSDAPGTTEKNGFIYPPPFGPLTALGPPPVGYRDPNAQDVELLAGAGVHRAVGWALATTPGSEPHAAYWDYELGTALSLGTLTGSPADWSRAFGVNELGEIVGFSTRSAQPSHAFLMRGGQMIDIDPRPDPSESFACGINRASQVAGNHYSSFTLPSTACRFDERRGGWQLTDLGTLGGMEPHYSYAHDLTDGALIVGWSNTDENGRTATMWLNDQIYDLNTLVPGAELYLKEATGVNLAGQIVGYGTTGAGFEQAYRLDPATLMMMQPVSGDPGTSNQLYAVGATPGVPVHFVYGFTAGSTPVPGCAGLVVDIASPKIVGSAVADSRGIANLSAAVPSNALGVTVLIQAVEQPSCLVSNLVSYTFQ